MKKILVTGAKGFIGSHIMEFYAQQGKEIIGWDLNDSENVKSVNLLDSESVVQRLKEDWPGIIIHCAGCADVAKSVQNPGMDFEGNVRMLHNILFALKKCQMLDTKLVFMSSAAVYGNPDLLPISEEFKTKPMSPYALHKVLAEEICHYFIDNYGMDIKIVRIFSAYGNGLRKQIFWDMGEKIRKTGMLNMFGTGNESRDYIHIRDIVQAIDLIISKSPKEIRTYNLANGEEVTIRQIAEKFAAASGLEESKIVFDNIAREGQPLNWQADIARIKRLGYQKSVSIDEGIVEYVKWIQSQENI